MKTILAIDPGASGGLAVLHDAANSLDLLPMPQTEGDILTAITLINREAVQVQSERFAYVEEVGGYCGTAQPGSGMFKFGRNFGFILGVLQATGWRVELVRPQKWQAFYGFGTVRSSGGKTPWKNKLKAEAQRRYPAEGVTLKTADALLILDWARNKGEAK